MNKRQKWIGIAAFAAVITVAISWSRSEEPRQRNVSVERIERAIGIYVTQRGQQYFSENLEDVLYRNGYAVSQGAWDGFSFRAKQAFSLDQLSPRMRPHAQTLARVREILKRWMVGFQFNDPFLQASLRDVSYELKFSRFGIRSDHAGARDRGIRNGILLALEIEIPQLRVDIARARASDRANEFLGEFGVDQFYLKTAPKSRPFRVSLPFSIDTDAQGKLNIEALQMQTNIASLTLEMGFRRPMVLPRVTITVNDRQMTLNQRALEDDLLAKQHELFRMLQSYIKETLERQIPIAINNTLSRVFDDTIGEVNEMNPVVLENPTPADKLTWGIQPEELKMQPEYVHLGFSAFIEDPRARRSVSLPVSMRANAKPKLNAIAPTQYDMALSINQGIVNRMMQLSFERGYFERYKTGPAEHDYVELLQVPEIHFEVTRDGRTARLKSRFRKKSRGFGEWLALKGGLDIELEMVIQVENHPSKGPRLKILRIDPASVKPDLSDVAFGVFKNRVKKAVADAIKLRNEEYARNDEALNDAFPIPPSVFGIPIRIKDMRVEDTGNLVLYLEYGVQNARR